MTTVQSRPELAERVHHAKEPVSGVAGPYGHPFHPIFVTIPIGAWVSSLVFDIAAMAQHGGNHPLAYASYWLMGIGVIGALVAAMFGLMDLVRVPRGTRALRVGLTHMLLNVSVVAAYVVNLVWRHGSYDDATKPMTGQLVLSIVALVVLAGSGWLGGMLAYRYGVRVADERTQVEGFA